jgi:predicted ATPase
MHLCSALASCLPYIKGVVPEYGSAWKKVLEIAETTGQLEYQLRALWGLWDFYISDGQYRAALESAHRFRALAESADPSDQLVGERLIGQTKHYLGDQPSARCHIERMLDRSVPPARSDISRFRSDQRVQARVSLPRILWLQGFSDQAICTAQSSVEDAQAIDHAISVCFSLALAACPIAFWVGDLAAAERYAKLLLDHSIRHGLAAWQSWGRSFEGALLIERGDVAVGSQHLLAGLDELGRPGQAARFVTFRGVLAGALGRTRPISEGLAAIDEGLEWCERTEGRWAIGEWLRIKGELLRLQGGPGATMAAEGHFRQALGWARRQGALSWELRTATSLARLWRDRGRADAARRLLRPVYDRFIEGFGTADLKAAKALLAELR